MRGHLPASRAAKRQRRRPENGPGIAAPAGVPRPVPPNRHAHFPNRQAHLARHACGLPHRTPPASRVRRSCPWPRSTPRRPAKTAQPPPVIPASIAQGMPWKHGSGSAYRTVRAGLPARAGVGRPTPTGLLRLVGRISRTAGCGPSQPQARDTRRRISTASRLHRCDTGNRREGPCAGRTAPRGWRRAPSYPPRRPRA